jgi:SH3-like domain-containing protein
MNGLPFLPAALVAALVVGPAAVAQTDAPPPVAKSALGHSAPGQQAKPAAAPAPVPVVTPPPAPHAQNAAPSRPGSAGKEPARRAPAAQPPKAPIAEPQKNPAAEPVKAIAEEPQKAVAAEPPKASTAEPPKGSVTGLPLPRWASLRADEVNLRSGPGMRYPIEWVYHRRDLPVQIEREFEGWRLIEDPDGVKGWVHQATLTGRRSFVVTGGERVLHRDASDDAAPVARLRPGVVGHIRACVASAAWCEVQTGDYRGFLRREDVYGIYAGEAIN